LVVFLVWQGANFADAANIAQETMTAAYRRWSEIDHPKAWARTAASRQLARHIASIEEDPVEPPEHNSLLPDSIDMRTWEQRHTILAALNHLSPRQRQVMAWTLDGYAPAEIASDLHISFDTVRANLTQGRRALTAYLGTTGDQQ
jgi:RNA polymerase sigma factor (sigma-70 family)